MEGHVHDPWRKSTTRSRPKAAGPWLPARCLSQARIGVTEGDAGQVADIDFDDRSWTVRYLVVDLGRWLPRPRVLLTPHAVARIDVAREHLQTTLTEAQLAGSPGGRHVPRGRPLGRSAPAQHRARQVLPTDWIMGIEWSERVVRVDVPRATVRAAPVYRRGMVFDRGLQVDLERRHAGARD
jgi:hypothetical protein